MADRVRMKSNTVFQNDRVTVFRDGGPAEGEPRGTVTVGDAFETDILHGKELARLGHAEPLGWSVTDVEDPPLEEHHQVSAQALAADRARRAKGKPAGATAAVTGTPVDTAGAAAVQANRADGLAPQPQSATPAAPPAPAAPKPSAKPAGAA